MKHTFRKCLSIVLALATLFSVCVVPLTAATPEASDPKCNHYAYIENADFVRTQAPTCEIEGGDIYHCPECNENFVHKDTWVDALGHDMQPNYEYENNVEPTDYATPGTLRYECSRCDKVEDRDWWLGCANNNHSVVTGEHNATCDKAGTRTDTCAITGCEWSEVVVVPALGHIWDDGVVTTRPICGQQNGVITFTCTRTGCDVDAATEGAQAGTYVVEKIAAVNHEWKWYAYDAGKCGVNGNQEGYKCEQCTAWSKDGVTLETGSFVIVNPDHVWSTCENADHEHEGNGFDGCHVGIEYMYCTNTGCGECKSFERLPTVHGNHVIKLVPLFDGNGDPILDNNNVQMTQKYVGPTLTFASNYTCFAPVIYTCDKCGAAVASPLEEDAPRHTWEHEVESTCTTYGYKVCGACGGVEGYADLDGNPIPGNEKYNKKPHLKPEDANLITRVGATCSSPAYIEYYCTRTDCEYSATGNTHGGTVTVDPGDLKKVKEYSGTALEHDFEIVDHVDATCTEPGVQGGKYCKNVGCTVYGASVKAAAEAVLPALGHTWADTDTTNDKRGQVEANCMYAAHEGELCGRCDLENLDQSKMDFSKNPNGEADPSKHDWDNSKTALVTAPTCTTTGSERKYCRICNQEHIAEVSALKHDWQNDTTIQPVGTVPATCHNDGYYVYYCQVCKVTAKGDTFKLADDMRDRFESHYTFTGNPKDDYTYDPNPATGIPVFVLTPQAHDAIADMTKPTELRPYENLIGEDDPTTPYLDGYDVTNNVGSCGVRSYYEWECDNCNYNYNKLVEDQYGATGTHLRIADPNAPVMDCVTNTIGVEGKEICKRCATILATGKEVPVEHTIDKTLPGYIGLTAATCLEVGFDEYGVCTKCTAANTATLGGEYENKTVGTAVYIYRWNNKVAALGHAAGTLVAKRVADCLLPGYDAHYLCVRNSDCGYVLNNAGIDFEAEDWKDNLTSTNWVTADAMRASAGTAAVINNYVKELGHDFETPSNLVPMLCMQDGYTWYDCGREGCANAAKVVNYKFGYANHRYSDKTHVTDVKCLESYCLCQNTVEYVITNETTGAETAATKLCLNKNVLREADNHKNAAGEVIDITDCLFYDDVEDHKCVSCENTFTIDEYNHKGEATHKLVAANCQNYSYELWACERCTQGWIANKGNTLGGHLYNQELADGYIAPTWTSTGYRKVQCFYCDDITEEILKAAEVYFSMDIANKFGGTVLVNGSRMVVTINMSAPGTDIYNVEMAVKFNNTILEWVDTKSVVTNVFGAGVTEVYCDNNGMDTVKIYAHAENNANGEVQNVTVNGTQMLVTLEFEIQSDAYLKDEKSVKDAITFGDITVLQYDASAFDKEGYAVGDEFTEWNYVETATATAADEIKVATEVAYPGDMFKNLATNGGAYELEIWMLGDLNHDGHVGIVDAGIMDELVLQTSGYNAQADLNKDGKVDTADFILMKQYMVEKLTYAELAKR